MNDGRLTATEQKARSLGASRGVAFPAASDDGERYLHSSRVLKRLLATQEAPWDAQDDSEKSAVGGGSDDSGKHAERYGLVGAAAAAARHATQSANTREQWLRGLLTNRLVGGVAALDFFARRA